MHGKLPIFGYRFHQAGTERKEDICYITDMKSADKYEFSKIDNSRVLVINALRYQREHPSHQNVIDVLNLLHTLESKPERTILTHLSHHAPCYKELVNFFPKMVLSSLGMTLHVLKLVKRLKYTLSFLIMN